MLSSLLWFLPSDIPGHALRKKPLLTATTSLKIQGFSFQTEVSRPYSPSTTVLAATGKDNLNHVVLLTRALIAIASIVPRG